MALVVLSLLLFVAIGVPVLFSVVDDAAMLTSVFGIAGLALFLVVPVLVLLFGRDGLDRRDRR